MSPSHVGNAGQPAFADVEQREFKLTAAAADTSAAACDEIVPVSLKAVQLQFVSGTFNDHRNCFGRFRRLRKMQQLLLTVGTTF